MKHRNLNNVHKNLGMTRIKVYMLKVDSRYRTTNIKYLIFNLISIYFIYYTTVVLIDTTTTQHTVATHRTPTATRRLSTSSNIYSELF